MKTTAGGFGTALLLMATTVLVSAAPASPPPVFKSDVDAVNLTVTISDGKRYVTDLTPEDFEVLEDGVPQELAIFSKERVPVSLVILLDTSLSMETKLAEAKEAAVRFVRRLRPQDEAQVVHFNERVRIVQEFTADAALLESAIRGAHAGGGTALYTSVYVALKELAGQRRTGELRRLAIVVLSDGEDTSSSVTDEQVLQLARSSEIGVYGISLRPTPAGTAGLDKTGASRYFISALSRETGADAHFPRAVSQLTGVYDRVLEELRSQYSMGYVSSNPRHDGKWRRIVIRLKRPALRVRHKPGYFAPSAE